MKLSDVSRRMVELDAPQNLDERGGILPIDGELEVCSWTPERDGKGQCTQVHVLFKPLPDMTMAIRLKSASACDALIAALTRHRNDVFGGGAQ